MRSSMSCWEVVRTLTFAVSPSTTTPRSTSSRSPAISSPHSRWPCFGAVAPRMMCRSVMTSSSLTLLSSLAGSGSSAPSESGRRVLPSTWSTVIRFRPLAPCTRSSPAYKPLPPRASSSCSVSSERTTAPPRCTRCGGVVTVQD